MPHHDNGWGIKCYPCPSARTYFTYIPTYVCLSNDVGTLKSNTSDQNFMKLGHIVKYHDVFKFNNGPYRTMLSAVMALCFKKINCFKWCPHSQLNSFDQNFMNFVKLFSTMMYSSGLIMVYMAPCFKELLPLVY